MGRYVGLLRGINVGGATSLPMAALRQACEALGWQGVQTYIQSGNVVFDADGDTVLLERALEGRLRQDGLPQVPVMVRSSAHWAGLVESNPFARESAVEPQRVMAGVPKAAVLAGAAEAIEARAVHGERVREAGGALWFHYPEGAGRSKLTPALIDRAAGSPVTARNWRTLLKLRDMLA